MLAVVAMAFVWVMLPSISRVPTLFGGIMPADKFEAGPRPARGNVRTLFSADDYPADAQANGQEGTVQAELSIDRLGRVSACTVLRSSRVRSLDEATCGVLINRARFRPARDAAGRAVPDTIVTPPITWRLEG